MALTTALDMAISGMITTSLKTNLTSQNVTNADKLGYTRKSLQVRYLSTNSGSTPIAGLVVSSQNKFLHAALNQDTSLNNKNQVISASLDYYIKQIGSTDGSNTLSSLMDTLYSTLQYVATNPDQPANKSQVVQTASNLSSALRDLSSGIQRLRQDAEHQINTSVKNVNAALDRLHMLNQKITSGSNNDASLSEYEDQRSLELQNLSKEMNIQYFYTNDNRVQVYTGAGQALLLTDPHYLTYNVNNAVNASSTYPIDFSPIGLDGTDITNSFREGALAANVTLRDVTYVEEQAKLNEFATTLLDEVNKILNTGASVPARTTTIGSLTGLTGATAFTATGTIQVAVTDSTGNIVSTNNVNLAAMTTVNDVLTALNGLPGITASLTTNGELSIVAAPSPNSVAINPLASSVTSGAGKSFSHYFGLNDMFTGTSAADIDVSSFLKNGPQYLAISVLNASATVGTRGVNRGDGTLADSVAKILTSPATSFSAAGNFSAQANSLISYVQAIMSDAASRADLSQQQSDTSEQIYKASYDLTTSTEGVNVDEETANLLLQQNQYQAGAQVVKTVQDMMQTLIDAIR